MAISRAQLVKELEPGLNALFGLEYKRYENQHAEIYTTESSDRAFEEEVMLSGFGDAAVKPEGQNVAFDTAIPIANMGATFGFATTTGSTTSGQSTNKMLLAGGSATANTWRTVRIAEDPENQDITVAGCSVVFVQNLNQYANGVTMA